jgi:hypothetical protein
MVGVASIPKVRSQMPLFDPLCHRHAYSSPVEDVEDLREVGPRDGGDAGEGGHQWGLRGVMGQGEHTVKLVGEGLKGCRFAYRPDGTC